MWRIKARARLTVYFGSKLNYFCRIESSIDCLAEEQEEADLATLYDAGDE